MVVTTLSPSRNSVISEYMTELSASVALRYMATFSRLGALMNCAIASNDASNCAVIARDASDWLRCTFSSPGARS